MQNKLKTYLCDSGPKSQKFDPRNSLNESIAKISSAFSTKKKKYIHFWVPDFIAKKLNVKYNRGILIILVYWTVHYCTKTMTCENIFTK